MEGGGDLLVDLGRRERAGESEKPGDPGLPSPCPATGDTPTLLLPTDTGDDRMGRKPGPVVTSVGGAVLMRWKSSEEGEAEGEEEEEMEEGARSKAAEQEEPNEADWLNTWEERSVIVVTA